MEQVRVWRHPHPSPGRLACHASGAHWLYAYGTYELTPLLKCNISLWLMY